MSGCNTPAIRSSATDQSLGDQIVDETLNFSGIIEKVTPDGRSAFVRLSHEVEGKTYAVISSGTQGRVGLARRQGHIVNGQKVVGLAKRGPDALKVIEVTLDVKDLPREEFCRS